MIVSNCPRCNEQLRIPTGEFPDDAYAQCPWCRETFPLSDVLTSLPPMLEILSADGQPIAAMQPVVASGLGGGVLAPGMPAIATGEPGRAESIDRNAGEFDFDHPASAGTVVGEDIPDSIEFDQAPDEDLDATVRNETVMEETISDETWNEEPSVSQVEEDAFPGIKDADDTWDGGQVAAPVAAMKVSPRRSMQKKGSTIKTVIMIVLGGLAAFPVAGVLLWAIGRPPVDLGFWPFVGPDNSNRRSVAAPPADLSAQSLSTPERPSGRPLNSSLSGDTLSTEGDLEDSAIEQIMDPSSGDVSLVESDGTDTGRAGIAPPDDPSVADQPAGPADVSITMPPDATITASPVEIVAIESGEDRPVDPEPVPEITSLKSPVESGLQETDLAASMPDSSADAAKPPPTRPMEEESASDESAESIAAADRAVEAFLNFQGSEKQRRGQLVKTYAQIAVACDLAAGESDSLRALAERLGNSSIRDDIVFAGSQWLEYKGRSSDGIALIGQPSTSDEGQTLILASGKEVPLTGGQPLPSAEKVLAMGRIVDEGSAVELVLAEPLP